MLVATATSRSLFYLRLKATASILALTLLANTFAVAAGAPKIRPTMDPVKLKEALVKRGVGKGIELTELDGTKDVGILTGVHDDSLDLVPKHQTKPITVSYAHVAAVRKDGMSTGAKVATGVVIGIVVGVAIIGIGAAIILRNW